MFQLVYPDYDHVPLIPPLTADDIDSAGNLIRKSSELLPVVDDSGMVIGKASRSYCHSGSKLLHPVVHLHVLRRDGSLYLQKRPIHKDVQPGKWDTAVGGHVDYGESVMEALLREAREELSLMQFNPHFIKSYVFESAVDRELVSIYAVVGSHFKLLPNPDELDGGRFWTPKEIAESMGQGIFTPNFESEYTDIAQTLYALL